MTILTNENKITATKDTLNYLNILADEAAKVIKTEDATHWQNRQQSFQK